MSDTNKVKSPEEQALALATNQAQLKLSAAAATTQNVQVTASVSMSTDVVEDNQGTKDSAGATVSINRSHETYEVPPKSDGGCCSH